MRGLYINHQEYKLSQYADDTQIFLDGSEQSLRNTLKVLKLFYTLSGLKVNMDKTSSVWIGSMADSDLVLCPETPLDWNEKTFKVLGVPFTNNVSNIWEYNTNEVKTKINNVFKFWSKRKLTLFGKVAIIKSLAISKLTHLLMNLPKPPKEFTKDLESMFFSFLWNRSPDKIKRMHIYKTVRQGGLGLLKWDEFTNSLKITWLRCIHQKEYSFLNLSNINFSKLFILGGWYAHDLAKTVVNPFWTDLLKAWSKYTKQIQIGSSIESVVYSQLWMNPKLEHFESCYFKSINEQWY